jgi:protein-disulfide isomerase
VLDDYEAALSQHGVRAIPTVVAPGGRRVIGAVSLAEYQRVLGL